MTPTTPRRPRLFPNLVGADTLCMSRATKFGAAGGRRRTLAISGHTDDGNHPHTIPEHRHRAGSARAALSYPDFRTMWIGSFASNIGTWMQNVVLPAYIYQRTGKASLVALLVFAQLGPLLILAIPGGVIADRFDRRKWLIVHAGGATRVLGGARPAGRQRRRDLGVVPRADGCGHRQRA